MQTSFRKEEVCLKDRGGLVIWCRDPMRMSRYSNMTNDAWANKNEINDLKTVNGNKLTICVDNTNMSEENDENEIGFICKYLGNVKIGVRRRRWEELPRYSSVILWLASDGLVIYTYYILVLLPCEDVE